MSTAASSTDEPMHTDEAASAEATATEEGATAMETQAEVNPPYNLQKCMVLFFLVISLNVCDVFFRENQQQL